MKKIMIFDDLFIIYSLYGMDKIFKSIGKMKYYLS